MSLKVDIQASSEVAGSPQNHPSAKKPARSYHRLKLALLTSVFSFVSAVVLTFYIFDLSLGELPF